MAKVNSTFSTDENIKKRFKLACVITGDDMSTLIESFMENYANLVEEKQSNQEN